MATLSLREAFERLGSPHALEAFSVLTGTPALVVDLSSDDPRSSAAEITRARESLVRLPCPSVGLRGESTSATAVEIADRFDLVVSARELAPVVEAVRRCPLASLALVQLLRQGEGLDIHEGLVAESLVYSTLQAGPEFGAWLSRRGAAPRSAPRGPAVRLARIGERLEIELNRPERRNAFSADMRDALAEALHLVLSDSSIAEVVIRGAGASFCSGGDLEEFGTRPDPATAHAVRSTRNVARLLAQCADRVLFEVHGACVGAGVELPSFGRRVRATPDAFFQLPEVGMGLVPGAGGTVSIPRRIGRQRAAYFALSGARLDASTALEWGLVDEIGPPRRAPEDRRPASAPEG